MRLIRLLKTKGVKEEGRLAGKRRVVGKSGRGTREGNVINIHINIHENVIMKPSMHNSYMLIKHFFLNKQ